MFRHFLARFLDVKTLGRFNVFENYFVDCSRPAAMESHPDQLFFWKEKTKLIHPGGPNFTLSTGMFECQEAFSLPGYIC
jgi:hypothetical protein